jgi:hypothetical protein
MPCDLNAMTALIVLAVYTMSGELKRAFGFFTGSLARKEFQGKIGCGLFFVCPQYFGCVVCTTTTGSLLIPQVY